MGGRGGRSPLAAGKKRGSRSGSPLSLNRPFHEHGCPPGFFPYADQIHLALSLDVTQVQFLNFVSSLFVRDVLGFPEIAGVANGHLPVIDCKEVHDS